MSDLEPITRNEKLWSGEDLTPVTRKEMYIKHLYDETQVIPEYPVTREEMFILKAGEELHDVTVEQLTATENGTYSEEGVAYSPVIVNVPAPVLDELTVTENGTYTPPSGTDGYDEVTVDVPLPENAYLLKEIEDVEIASFDDGSDLPMPKLEVAIEPVQDLHGYDSPWVGGSGRNLFSVGSRVDGTIADVRYTSDDEYIYLNGTKQGSGYADLSSSSNITLDSGTYYIRAFVISGTASNTVELYPYDGTNNLTGNVINNERTLTLSESKTFRFRFAIWTDGTVLNNYKLGIVISKTANIDKFYPYSNICPIIGWDECNVTVADDTTDPTTENVYTLDLDGTRYGGKVDLVSGVMTVEKVSITLDNLGDDIFFNSGYNCWLVGNQPKAEFLGNYEVHDIITSVGYVSKTFYAGNKFDNAIGIANDGRIFVGNSSSTVKPVGQVVYKLATPLTIQLTPTVVKSLRGMNNVFADSGNILDLSYLAKEE